MGPTGHTSVDEGKGKEKIVTWLSKKIAPSKGDIAVLFVCFLIITRKKYFIYWFLYLAKIKMFGSQFS